MKNDCILPRAYGLPKIHKENLPFRIIVSSVNSPLHNLATFFHNVLTVSFDEPISHIRNSGKFVERMRDISLRHDDQLVSLDVVSLFTNIPLDLTIDIISHNWNRISSNTSFSKEEFITGIKFILFSTYFKFGNKIYKQTFGSPMGSPISPIIASITMSEIERKALNLLSFKPTFYYRYVDDIILAVPENELNSILNKFNSIHNRLQFTIEISTNGRINFLDTTLIKNNNVILFNWYQKPSYSGRYLNYFSQHPMSQKIGIIYGLIDRILYYLIRFSTKKILH